MRYIVVHISQYNKIDVQNSSCTGWLNTCCGDVVHWLFMYTHHRTFTLWQNGSPNWTRNWSNTVKEVMRLIVCTCRLNLLQTELATSSPKESWSPPSRSPMNLPQACLPTLTRPLTTSIRCVCRQSFLCQVGEHLAKYLIRYRNQSFVLVSDHC